MAAFALLELVRLNKNEDPHGLWISDGVLDLDLVECFVPSDLELLNLPKIPQLVVGSEDTMS